MTFVPVGNLQFLSNKPADVANVETGCFLLGHENSAGRRHVFLNRHISRMCL